MYLANMKLPDSSHLLLYMESRRSQPHGSLALLHAGPVELLYYWFYRAPHDSTTTSSTLATILTTTLSSAELITNNERRADEGKRRNTLYPHFSLHDRLTPKGLFLPLPIHPSYACSQLSVINEDPCGKYRMEEYMFGPGRALTGKWAGGKIGVGFVILHLPKSLIPFYIMYSSAVTKNWSTFDGIMATKPGILTDWPWTPLGNFKYIVIAPWAVHSTYRFVTDDPVDLGYSLVLPFLLFRILHNQVWISLSRYYTTKGKRRILDKGIDFNQVDRETNWDHAAAAGEATSLVEDRRSVDGGDASRRAGGVPLLLAPQSSSPPLSLLPLPFPPPLLYPVIHPFAEHIAYFILFAIPLLTTLLTRTASIASFAGYVIYIDFMNNMGHCNFELIPLTAPHPIPDQLLPVHALV
ncbi:hypothetical protein IGI04_039134 [Brassica rapa subsp. trilocularis]|uniref:Fatty acid hydroxylase domain-containing protein n=1 Tax=Brassica rapa subsp. trilocularis TaxID=1813537 RepID=A0ABQ7LM69_BRACM|nr:hypothetical protein IGI04_039134 [Brassica rapa subsp. trilocularis]